MDDNLLSSERLNNVNPMLAGSAATCQHGVNVSSQASLGEAQLSIVIVL